MSVKTGVGLSSAGGGLGYGVGHGYAYSVLTAAASFLGPVLVITGGILVVSGLVSLMRDGNNKDCAVSK